MAAKKTIKPRHNAKHGTFTGQFECVAFPDDLYNPEDLSKSRVTDFVAFTMNVNSKSKMAQRGKATREVSTKAYVDFTKNSKALQSQLFNYGGSAAIAATLGKVNSIFSSAEQPRENGNVTNAENNNKGLSDDVKSVVDAFKSSFSALTVAQFKKVNKLIMLPMPISVRTNYGMEYGNVSSDAILQGILGVVNSGSLKGQAGKDAVDLGTKELVSKIADSTGMGEVSKLIDKASGQVKNPRTEQLFNSVSNREFTFDYLFAPRSKPEMEHLREIIKLFKINMHPEIDGYFYTVPNEFDIDFFSITRGVVGTDPTVHQLITNPTVPKVSTCVLVDLNIDYAPNGHYVSMVDGGIPFIALSLRFKELQPLHRRAVEAGY